MALRRNSWGWAVLATITMAFVAAGDPPAQNLRVALAQPLVTPGDVRGNLARIEPLVVEAAKRGARLVVFSECALTGYDLKGVGVASALRTNDAVFDGLSRLARKQRVAIVAGFHEKLGDARHNTAAILLADGRRVFQRKHLILAPEKAIAPVRAAERRREFLDIDGFKCAVLICSDAGIPRIFEDLAAEKCDAVIIITAGAGDESFGVHASSLSDAATRKRIADQSANCLSPESIEQCMRLNLAQIACNQIGWEPTHGYFHPGGSSIIDRTGEVTAVIPPRVVFERVKPDLAVGFVSRKADPPVRRAPPK